MDSGILVLEEMIGDMQVGVQGTVACAKRLGWSMERSYRCPRFTGFCSRILKETSEYKKGKKNKQKTC